MEAAIAGVQGIAFSLDRPEELLKNVNYETTGRVAARVVEMVAQYGFPQNTVLNVNVPYLPWEELKGFQITRMGTRIYRDELVRREDPRGRAYYWIGGDTPTGKLETGTDYGAMKEGFVSITPISLDLTAHPLLDQLSAWKW